MRTKLLILMLAMLSTLAFGQKSPKGTSDLYSIKMTESELEKRVVERAKTLENVIQRVVDYGKTGRDASEFISQVVLDNFLNGADIQTASISRNGKMMLNDPISYEKYFQNIWKKASINPSLRIRFASIRVIKMDTYRYKVTVAIEQEYDTNTYKDTTTKNLEIHLVPKNNGFVEKIGNARVVDIRRRL